jgi:hypothetical protein
LPVGLELDLGAQRLLERHPGKAVVIDVIRVRYYGVPSESLAIKWRRARDVEKDSSLKRIDVQQGVPIYAHPRVAAYARWHPLRITEWTLAWWHRLAIYREIEVWYNMLRWERTHPTLRGQEPRRV